MESLSSVPDPRKVHGDVPVSTDALPCKPCVFAIAIIAGIGALAVAAVGVAGYFQVGALSNLSQIHAIIMMAAGGGGGIILLVVGIVGAVKKCHTPVSDQTHQQRATEENEEDPAAIEKEAALRAAFVEDTRQGAIRGDLCFGFHEWKRYIGEVDDQPLPENYTSILEAPCPFSQDPNVKVKDTHMLVLIPKTVNGKPVDLLSLFNLFGTPKEGPCTSCPLGNGYFLQRYSHITVEKSHWVLMTRQVIPQSLDHGNLAQLRQLRQYKGYEAPTALEAAICTMVEHVTSGHKLFSNTFTRCAEIQVDKRNTDIIATGGFDVTGLKLERYEQAMPKIGMAALRRL